MGNEKEAFRLSQIHFLNDIGREFNPLEMITVYSSSSSKKYHYGIYCALIPSCKIEDSLKRPSWDLMHGHGLPASSVSFGKKEQAKYHRFGDESGIEPLVIDREFHGLREDYKELSEEFRLFHNLYHEKKDGCFIKFDDAGNDSKIAIFEDKLIKVRLKELREFLAIKEMHLAILFDCREHSKLALQEIGVIEGEGQHRDNLLVWSLYFGEFTISEELKSFSRLLGKRLIPPFSKEKSGYWGFAEEKEKKFVDFIIGLDEAGEEITHTSNPDALANNFGGNPGAPNYLTPVCFRKQVLDKYYQQPSKFSVEDSYLRCAGLWGMQLDNHHETQVFAWLGDLGRDLPYEEQLHWRAYNISSIGGVSKTFYKRQILAQFADSEMPEHNFYHEYKELRKVCDDFLGWPLILPLSKEDQHFFKSIRVPATDEQKDFDELVLALTKIIIDSINEKQLCKLLSAEQNKSIKGSIARLEAVFVKLNVIGFEDHIAFLRSLQSLRSTGAAHRKGENYQKLSEEIGTNENSLRTVFDMILRKALDFLRFLNENVRSKKIKTS